MFPADEMRFLLLSCKLFSAQTASNTLNPQHHLSDQRLGAELLLKTDKDCSLKELTVSFCLSFFFLFFCQSSESVGVGEQKAVCHSLFLSLSLSFPLTFFFNTIIRRALLLAVTAAGQET